MSTLDALLSGGLIQEIFRAMQPLKLIGLSYVEG